MDYGRYDEYEEFPTRDDHANHFDLLYSEGPGTSEYVVLFDSTMPEIEAYKQRFSWLRSQWKVQPTVYNRCRSGILHNNSASVSNTPEELDSTDNKFYRKSDWGSAPVS